MSSNLSKETYLKPSVTSEVLEPGALACYGSPTGTQEPVQPWLAGVPNPSCGFCCEE
jgi:hypothetical protein